MLVQCLNCSVSYDHARGSCMGCGTKYDPAMYEAETLTGEFESPTVYVVGSVPSRAAIIGSFLLVTAAVLVGLAHVLATEGLSIAFGRSADAFAAVYFSIPLLLATSAASLVWGAVFLIGGTVPRPGFDVSNEEL